MMDYVKYFVWFTICVAVVVAAADVFSKVSAFFKADAAQAEEVGFTGPALDEYKRVRKITYGALLRMCITIVFGAFALWSTSGK